MWGAGPAPLTLTRGEGRPSCCLSFLSASQERTRSVAPPSVALFSPKNKNRKMREPLGPHPPAPPEGVANAAFAPHGVQGQTSPKPRAGKVCKRNLFNSETNLEPRVGAKGTEVGGEGRSVFMGVEALGTVLPQVTGLRRGAPTLVPQVSLCFLLHLLVCVVVTISDPAHYIKVTV